MAFLSNLFQSEQTRGLSGDSAAAVALDEANPYYNYRLRRHKADGDLVADANLIWFTSASVKRRGGLGVHIASEKGDGTAGFTDVLIILSHEDYGRAMAPSKDPWMPKAMRTVLREFEAFGKKEGFERRYAHRQLGLRILCDGSMDMGGQSLGLEAGDFITGLLPNLYTGPVKGSHPVIGVHLNLPGVWDGYKEVGRLYNDQILFTIGNHWLDNFSNTALREGALYRLQQYPDGSFVHIVNPDLQDRYQVASTDQGGASVLTLATRDGVPLAYLVLAVIDAPEDLDKTVAGGVRKPNIAMPTPGKRPGGDAPSISAPMLIDDEVQVVPISMDRVPLKKQTGTGALGSKTILPDAPAQRIFTLQERGALLQKVHFGNFMEGYDVYLGMRGEVGTAVEDKAATFSVRRKKVSLTAHVGGVQIDGQTVPIGQEFPIEKDVAIQVAGHTLEYKDLRTVPIDAWPYVGEIRRPASSTYLPFGEEFRIGRSRDCRVVLPDEPRNENIVWKVGISDGATIRARTGEIPKSRFYTDSIMVASEHGAIDLKGEDPVVQCTARHCYVYVRRGAEIISLFPTESGKEPTQTSVIPGDEVLIGNCLFQIGYPPTKDSVAVGAPAPKVELSSDAMVGAVAAAALGAVDSPPTRADADVPPPPPARRGGAIEPSKADRPADDEAPAAWGLGQAGHAPKPVPVPSAGLDSIIAYSPGAPEGLRGPVYEDEQLPPPTNPKRSDTPPPPPARPSPDDPPPPRKFVEPQSDIASRVRIQSMSPDLPPTPTGRTVQLYDDDDEPVTDVGARKADPWKLGDAWDADAADPPKRADIAFDDEPAAPAPPAPTAAPAAPPTEAAAAPEPVAAAEPDPEPVAAAESDPEPVAEPAPDPEAVATAPAQPDPEPIREPEPAPAPVREPVPAPAPEPPAPEPAPEPPAPEPEPAPTPAPAPDPISDPDPEPVAPISDPEPAPEPAPAPIREPADAPPQRFVDAATAPTVVPAMSIAPHKLGDVVAVDDREAQFELGRRMQLVHVGWSLNGRAVCGNHRGADLIIPESRVDPDQSFEARDYFVLQVRGRRGSLELVSPRELLINGDDPAETLFDEPEKITIDVIRRDDQGNEDFAVRLVTVEDRSLPDPRARLVEIDVVDPLTAALFTVGLPTRQARVLTLGGVSMTMFYDGEGVTVSDYLASYHGPDGFKPFFVQVGAERFQTAPEDGSEMKLLPGDRLVVGGAVYTLRKG